MSAPHEAPHEGTAPPDVAALRMEIDRTRSELGETVAELAARTDVKARARDAAIELRGQAAAALRRPVPWVFLGAAAVGATLVWLIWRRRS